VSGERWRKPAEVLAVEETHQGIWLPDGRVQGVPKFVFSDETADRMRSGYMCANCQEPFEQPWPERCHVCHVSVRKGQAEFFAREFGGTERVGPASNPYDGGIHERAAKAKEQSNV
jgi:hypothetical protein